MSKRLKSQGAVEPQGSSSNPLPAFLMKLWTMVEDEDTNHIIFWSVSGSSFIVSDQAEFAKEVLPKYFKHNNMASFVRQLNMYGFRKVVNFEHSGLMRLHHDFIEFQHSYFLRGQEPLLDFIKRKTQALGFKNEEPWVQQVDLNQLLNEMRILHEYFNLSKSQLKALKEQIESLWREIILLRQNCTQQKEFIKKLILFIFELIQTTKTKKGPSGVKRKLSLEAGMTNSYSDGAMASQPPAEEPHPGPSYFTQSPSSEPIPGPSCQEQELEPFITDVTEASFLPSLFMLTPAQNEKGESQEVLEGLDLNLDGLQQVVRSQESNSETLNGVELFSRLFTESELNLLLDITMPSAQLLTENMEGDVAGMEPPSFSSGGPPRSMGNTNEKPSEIIQRERKRLVQTLQEDSGLLLDGLLAQGVLTEPEYEVLDAIPDPERRIRRLLVLVQQKGEFACRKLLECAAQNQPDPYWDWQQTGHGYGNLDRRWDSPSMEDRRADVPMIPEDQGAEMLTPSEILEENEIEEPPESRFLEDIEKVDEDLPEILEEEIEPEDPEVEGSLGLEADLEEAGGGGGGGGEEGEEEDS
ncbi:heat shock factor protein 1-like isoform X2 [Ornithorhynchus anatinus]|uniref:heat shock factor protein 1-like isoform X2 n=1 Tax=Ornithorhynchus anatinus TaxID=9258 RepID=UPI0010A8A5F1|nr:heat shock factor protein 1-like isoform X2 [Ornithorhynchus anatinus]